MHLKGTNFSDLVKKRIMKGYLAINDTSGVTLSASGPGASPKGAIICCWHLQTY